MNSSYIHALKWQTRNGVVQMQSPEFGDIVIHHLSSPCIELIFVRHSIKYGNMISLRTRKVILSLTCFPIWIVIFCEHAFNQDLHKISVLQRSAHTTLDLMCAIPYFPAILMGIYRFYRQKWVYILKTHRHKIYLLRAYGRML